MGAGLHGDDLAGDGGMDGDAQTLAVTDLLTKEHPVAYGYQALAGGADVLQQGDDYLLGGHGTEFRDGLGHFFVVLGVDTAKEQAFHSFTSFMF